MQGDACNDPYVIIPGKPAAAGLFFPYQAGSFDLFIRVRTRTGCFQAWRPAGMSRGTLGQPRSRELFNGSLLFIRDRKRVLL